MGQILSNPVIDKEQGDGRDGLSAYGLCAMQGWRMSMEDSHIVDLNIGKDKSHDQIACYCIFDGHGGSTVAQFCGEHFSRILRSQEEFKREKPCFSKALVEAFIAADEELLQDPVLANDHSGCTATTLLISKKQNLLVCANSGDSRTVLSCGKWAKVMSFDHKPTLRSEHSRIVAADGFVEMDRVNGNLALSRAIGDFEFKSNMSLPPHEQIVTCVPEILEHTLNYENDEFVVLACDGIWDCLSSQECVDLVHYGIQKEMSLAAISSRIIDVCCSPTTEGTGIGCDNMSIIIVALLKDGETEEKWLERMRDKQYQGLQSFEVRRKKIFSYHYDFSTEHDDSLFDISTKQSEERSRPNESFASKNTLDSEEPQTGDSEDGVAGTPTDSKQHLYSLEELISTGSIQITQSGNDTSYIHGSALSEVLASLVGATSGIACRKGELAASDLSDTDDEKSEQAEE